MPNLELAYHHLSDADLEETFQTGGFHYEMESQIIRPDSGVRVDLLFVHRPNTCIS